MIKCLYFISGCVFLCLITRNSFLSLILSLSIAIIFGMALSKVPRKLLTEHLYIRPVRLLASCCVWACLVLGIGPTWDKKQQALWGVIEQASGFYDSISRFQIMISVVSIFFIIVTINLLWDGKYTFGHCIASENTALEKKTKKWYLWIAFFAICIIACMKNPTNPFSNSETSVDQSVFRYVGWVMSEGGVPYRDTFDHKGPLLYFINYIGSLISFDHGIWIVGLVFLFISVIVSYRLARLSASGKNSFLAVAAAFAFFLESYQGGNMVEEWALPFLLISIYIFMDYFLHQNISWARTALCGFSFACVSLLRVNMISVWIVFCCMVLIQCIWEKRLLKLAEFILEFVLGMSVVLAPTAVYLLKNHGMQDFINDYILFNFLYSNDSVRASWINRLSSSAFYFDTVYFVAAIAVMFLVIREDKARGRRFLNIGYVAMMLISVMLITMGGQHYAHYGIAFVPLLIYPYSVLSECGRQTETGEEIISPGSLWKMWKHGVAVCIALLWGVTAITPEIEKRDSPYLERLAKSIEAYSAPTDKIIVFGNKNIIYLKTKRSAASKYSYQVPIGNINKDIRKEFMAELEADPPKIAVQVKGLKREEKNFLDNYPYECVDSWNSYAVYCLKEE